MNNISYQGRHSIFSCPTGCRSPCPVYLLDNHSPLAVSRELRLTCSLCLQNVAEIHASPNLLRNSCFTKPSLPRTPRQPLDFPNRSCPRTRLPKVDKNETLMDRQLTSPDSAPPSGSLRSNKSMKHWSCNPVAAASFQQFIMPTVHNWHQPLFMHLSTFCSPSRLRQARSTNRPALQQPPARSTRQ